MRNISIFETEIYGQTIYWLVTYSFVVIIWRPFLKLLGTDHFITERGRGSIIVWNVFFISKKILCLFPWTHENLPHLGINKFVWKNYYFLLTWTFFIFFLSHMKIPNLPFFSNEMVGALQVLWFKDHSYHSLNMYLRKMHFQCSGEHLSIVEYCKETLVWDCKETLVWYCKETLVWDCKETLVWDCKETLVWDCKETLVWDCKETLVWDCKTTLVWDCKATLV